MKVVGLLSFYDEKANHLSASVGSLCRAGVDHVVAMDGAYQLYPDGTGYSGPEQHEAIRQACHDHGTGCTIVTPPGVWAGNEIEKRTALFRVGHALCDPYTDWMFVIDADEQITHASDWRDQLEHTTRDVGAVLHGEPGVRPRSERRLFRAHPDGIRVHGAHYFYIDGEQRVLWGPGQIDRELVDIQMLHRPRARTEARNIARNVYYEMRLQANAEPAW